MVFNIEDIFLPAIGVDLVFNINSLVPYSRSSIIYDIDFARHTVTIAQPLIPLSDSKDSRELYLTTTIQNKNKKIRVGVNCYHLKLIERYTLANKTKVPAVLLTYELPVKETNIRSAFRLPLSTKHIIKGKFLYGNIEYHTSRDFSIRDISLGGLGIVLPKKRNKVLNPLTQIKINEDVMVGITLIDMDQNKPTDTLPVKAQIIRINSTYSETHTLVGLKILNLNGDDETILNKFIHDAQIDELKRMSGRNL